MTLVRRLTSPTDRSRRFVAAPAAAVSGRVAQVDDERIEAVGQAAGGGGVTGAVELAGQRLQPLLAVALAGGVVERLPVGLPTRSRSRSGSPPRTWRPTTNLANINWVEFTGPGVAP